MNSPCLDYVPQSDTGGSMRWYALQARARSEQAIVKVLAAKGFECYVPCWVERRAYSDRMVSARVPAFADYIFCRFSLAERLRILQTPGIRCIVGSGRTPQVIEDDLILSLRKVFSCERPVSPTAYVQAGDTIRIVHGPLAGATGNLIRIQGTTRLVISVHLLQRSVSVELDSDAKDLRRRSVQAA